MISTSDSTPMIDHPPNAHTDCLDEAPGDWHNLYLLSRDIPSLLLELLQLVTSGVSTASSDANFTDISPHDARLNCHPVSQNLASLPWIYTIQRAPSLLAMVSPVNEG